MANLEQFIQNMVNMCNDNSYGYRLGGWGPKDYDCASSIITALRNAGFDTGSATYTGNMAAELCARGWTRLPVGTSLNSGDILLNEVNHVALYVGNNQLAEFSSDYDGASGDSSGKEASVHGYYNFPWDCILRYKGNTETEEIKNVHLYEWNGGDNQRWKLIKDTDGFYEMQCKGNGLFLDVHEGKDENGQNVVAYKRNGTNAQKWKIIPVNDSILGNFAFELAPKINTNKRLDVFGNGVDNHTNIDIYDTNGSDAQRFYMRPIGEGYYQIININSLKSVDGGGIL